MQPADTPGNPEAELQKLQNLEGWPHKEELGMEEGIQQCEW